MSVHNRKHKAPPAAAAVALYCYSGNPAAATALCWHTLLGRTPLLQPPEEAQPNALQQ